MNWIFFQRIVPLLLNVTQRIESSLKNVKNWSFSTCMTENSTFFLNLFIWLEELNIFWYDSTELNLFWACDSIELNIWEFDSKHFNLFIHIWRTELNISFLKEYERAVFFLNYLWFNSQNWTPSWNPNITHRIEHLFLQYDSQN